MPDALPRTIDGRFFARERREIRGRLGPEALPRLAASGARTNGLDFVVSGGRNAQGKEALWVRSRGEVEMDCQRCLAPLVVPLVVDAELELADSAGEIATAEDDIDRVVASPAMPLAQLVEDELLLALPMVPRHEACEPPGEGYDAGASPFAALGRLRRVH